LFERKTTTNENRGDLAECNRKFLWIYGFTDLKSGKHKSGLDIISEKYKIAIELKNRTNTDNASSKKTNLSKLAKFKKENKDYTCIYANINDTTKEKTKGYKKTIIHDYMEIIHYVGYEFLQFIFGEHVKNVIQHIRNKVDEYFDR
jgi:hypothetical protein